MYFVSFLLNMREEIEKILEEFDARYGHLSTASRVVHLYGSHGKMIEDMRQFLENALKKRHKKARV